MKWVYNLVYKFLKFLCGTEPHNKNINRTVLWSMFSAGFTVLLMGIALFQLSDIRKTNSAEFSHKITNDFFTESNINLLTLFDENVLMVDTAGEVAWFYIDTTRYKSFNENINLHNAPLVYQANQIDYLLHNFEDLGLYQKKGLVAIDDIYEGFDYYVESTWENKQVSKYIAWLRNEPGGADCYTYFEYLYKKLKKYPLIKVVN
jgi:hypothetical protein